MMIEHSPLYYQALLALPPIVVITIDQIKAIKARDNHHCTLPIDHNCHGKLTVHHICGKDDLPENLTTVCHEAHWNNLHNTEREDDEKKQWNTQLAVRAEEKTKNAIRRGWFFPNE